MVLLRPYTLRLLLGQKSFSIVTDLHYQHFRKFTDADSYMTSLCMFINIAERFLNEAENGNLERRRQHTYILHIVANFQLRLITPEKFLQCSIKVLSF